MPKVCLDSDEWYPVYQLVTKCDIVVEVSEEQLTRWKRVDQEFSDMQTEMSDLTTKYYDEKEIARAKTNQ